MGVYDFRKLSTLEIRRREICVALYTAPVITQGNIYCDMSVTLQLHVHLLITIIIFFFPQMSSVAASTKTLIMCWIVKYYHLQAAAKQTADD